MILQSLFLSSRLGGGAGPRRLREPRLLLALHVRHADLELCRSHRHGGVGEFGSLGQSVADRPPQAGSCCTVPTDERLPVHSVVPSLLLSEAPQHGEEGAASVSADRRGVPLRQMLI